MRAATVVRGCGSLLAAAWVTSSVLSVVVPGPTLGPADVPPDPAADEPPGRRPAPPDSDTRPDGPLVTIVVPMRNEADRGPALVRSVLAQRHRTLQLVVVDDGSTDGTVAAVRAAADDDPRLEVLTGAPLPPGWVGKPWACHQGARAARGAWIVFCDADVVLHEAAISALLLDAARHDDDVVSWVGLQELGTVAERVVNPVIFFFIASLTPLPLANAPWNRIVAVNGQWLAFRRAAYAAIGGHAAVADAVVEDLGLAQIAQRRFGRGYRFVWVHELLRTRMYRGWAELREGWSKNLALGGAVVGMPRWVVVAGLAVGGVGPWIGTVARLLGHRGATPYAVAAAAQVAAIGGFVRRFSGEAPWWGMTAPLGTVAATAIAAESWWRTRRGEVRWRGRTYAARR